MQIEIDFEVFKALTALRVSEADSYNAVVRRLLKLPEQNSLAALVAGDPTLNAPVAENALLQTLSPTQRKGLFGSRKHRNALAPADSICGLLGRYAGGVWFGNSHFPEGTKFRATYKGRTYFAEVKDGQWMGEDGHVRSSPSDAAGAISGTNVNGWRFWHVQMPGDPAWQRMDEFKA